MDTAPLSKIYNDPSHSAGFSTAQKLWESSGKSVSLKKIKEWLNFQDAHTLHRPIRKNTFNYVSVLPKLIQAYNNSIHSSIGVSPSGVNHTNAFKIKLRQVVTRPRPPRFSVGDHVRISKERMPFKKESILRGNRVPTYKLADLNGEPIVGSFYKPELSKTVVSEETEFKIEKITKRCRKGRGWEYFVKWMGYPESFNSWVKASALETLR
ncbi:hypothetical protein J437_LFUL003811 [Ladona fulva]|uniref:Chromo domain-containing protein n=1 Tax=Ladona fulva TaxID=123851 RepID=A0A8K0KGU9_LADFU|nr:hypothetical protein J437_LFUL003811 [Ladona fulva]